jgi:hypothetical protein
MKKLILALALVAAPLAAQLVNPAPVGAGGASTSTSDATAANQAAQIAAEQAIRDRAGDTTAPAAGTTNARLATVATTLNTLATLANQTTELAKLDTLNTSQGSTTTAVNALAPKLDALATTTGATPTLSVSGTLAGLGQTVEVPLNGASSGLWVLSSTNFIGTVVAEGCVEATCTTPGGRLLFKSGVGSIGTNAITLAGGVIAREYRVVTGGNRMRLRVTAYTSGTMSAIGFAQATPNLLFVNGPVHTAEEEAVRAGRAYIMSTAMQSVAAGSFLNATISNPTGSGVNVFVTMRMFECNQANGATPAEWTTYANPTTVPATTSAPVNRMLGGGASTTVFRYAVSGTALAGGTVADSGTVYTGGGPTPNVIMSTLVPGQTGGVVIGGGGGGLAAAQRCKVSYAIYEESTN